MRAEIARRADDRAKLDADVRIRREAWETVARPNQLPPGGDWFVWLVLAGRGFGKTRLAMEDAAWYGLRHGGVRIALIAATYADARDTMVEGQSGLLDCIPRSALKAWNRSLGEVILTNGAQYKIFAATEPDRLRGPQHHRAYCDELAAWYRPKDAAGNDLPSAWDQMLFGLRLGAQPRVIIATTPKPTPTLRRIIADQKTVITRGRTEDNAANLAATTLALLRQKYDGTRLGRQELNGEVIDDVPGALWTREMIDAARAPIRKPDMQRVVVAIDPSGASGDPDEKADSIGIVVAGKGVDGRAYVLADRTCRLSPAGWARRAVEAYHEFKADRIVAERNFGGAMVESTIRAVDPNVAYREVVATSRTGGKHARAEPVAALYEKGNVSHVAKDPDELTKLEDQMCEMSNTGYLGQNSPDRLDAMVWALTELMLGWAKAPPIVVPYVHSVPRAMPGSY